MKHLHTFESYINNLNEANSFKEGDFVKWQTPTSGNQNAFGIVTKVMGRSFKAMVIADGGGHQPTTGFGIGPGGSELWKPGITADELRKEIEKAGVNGSYATVRFEKASPWNLNESFLNEGNQKMGPAAAKFTKVFDSYRTVDQLEGKIPVEVSAFIKRERLSNEDAGVVYSQEAGDDDLLATAKSTGITYEQFEDVFDMGIVFSLKK
jgi:hypothetical protein